MRRRFDDLTVGRIGGVDVGVSWGLLAVGALFAVSLAMVQLPRLQPGFGGLTYWLVAGVMTLLFVASILVHELGHAVIARNEGVGVDGITLWVFGGVARLAEPPKTAGSEGRIAAAGPAATGLAAGVFWLAALLTRPEEGVSLLASAFDWLSRANLLLLALNLLPALPLDGGRILGSVVWGATGRRSTGTLVAARTGWVIGAGLVTFGLLRALDGSAEGMWALVVGGFVLLASVDTERWERLQRSWTGRTVGDVTRRAPVADDWLTVEGFLRALDADPRAVGTRLYPVRGADGRAVGLVSWNDLVGVAPNLRARTAVGTIAEPRRDVPVLHPDHDLADAVARHPELADHGVLVADASGVILGIVTPAELLSPPPPHVEPDPDPEPEPDAVAVTPTAPPPPGATFPPAVGAER